MRNGPGLWLTVILLAFPLPSVAQDHDHRSPYAGREARDIKALSSEEILGLLRGEGMSLALSAELNGLPGPRHVLDMRSELRLTPDQEQEVQAVFDAMSSEAQGTGARIVELEHRLDRAFGDGTITEDSLDDFLQDLALQRAQLRAAHLKAHLRLLPILSRQQRADYNRLRGYATQG